MRLFIDRRIDGVWCGSATPGAGATRSAHGEPEGTEQPFSDFAIPRRVAADVVPLYAFERAMDIIQGLAAEYQNLATALAEAKPDSADEVAAYLRCLTFNTAWLLWSAPLIQARWISSHGISAKCSSSGRASSAAPRGTEPAPTSATLGHAMPGLSIRCGCSCSRRTGCVRTRLALATWVAPATPRRSLPPGTTGGARSIGTGGGVDSGRLAGSTRTSAPAVRQRCDLPGRQRPPHHQHLQLLALLRLGHLRSDRRAVGAVDC